MHGVLTQQDIERIWWRIFADTGSVQAYLNAKALRPKGERERRDGNHNGGHRDARGGLP